MVVEEFIALIKRSPTNNGVFHFADNRNIGSIRSHGLLSRRVLTQRGLTIPAPGGNQWSFDADDRLGLDDYVHLCFFTEHPMEYTARNDGRIINSTFLRINPDVIRVPGALLSLGVSNQSGIHCLHAITSFDKLDLDVIYSITDWGNVEIKKRLQAARCCELLIPKYVPLEMIRF